MTDNIVIHENFVVALDVSILAGRVRPTTAARYTEKLKEYVDFAGSADQALRPEIFARWSAHLAKSGQSPNTINASLVAVRSLMKEAGRQGYIDRAVADAFGAMRGVSVSAMRDKLKPNARTRISPEDMRRLVDAPDTTRLAGKMHRALLLAMASSGARCSEVINIAYSKIDPDNGSYTVEVLGKTDITPRKTPLSIEAKAAIDHWIDERSKAGVESNYVFTGFTGRGSRGLRTNRISPSAAWQIVQRYAKAVGLEHIKPHDFRRFVGTTLAAVDPRQAQKVLGHQNINTTYTHYVLDDMKPGLTEGLF
jgi:integrase/recombinase XerD